MNNTHDTIQAPSSRESLLARSQRELTYIRKRRSYISSPETQQSIVRQFMLVLAIGVALGLANAYVLASFSDIEIRLLPGADYAEAAVSLLYMASLAITSIGLVLLLAVFYSHRIGGPVFKIVEELERFGNGDLRGRVKLRETDLLTDVAAAVNDVRMTLERRVGELDSAVIALRDCAALSPEAEQYLSEVEKALEQLGGTPRSRGASTGGKGVLNPQCSSK